MLQVGEVKKLSQIDTRHSQYKLHCETWKRLGWLYASGHTLKQHASEFLMRRPKEINDVFQARLDMFTHVNHLGTALDWYCGTMFGDEPGIQPSVKAGVNSQPDSNFYDAFFKDCDRAGTSFVDLFRTAFQNVLLYRNTYVLLDKPAFEDGAFRSLAEQNAARANDPYLCVFSPLDVINWKADAYGNLEWVTIKNTVEEADPFGPPKIVDRWYHYDRTTYQVWKHVRGEKEDSNSVATLESRGLHALAHANQVPVERLEVPEGLWLANRAMLSAIAHLNIDNVLQYAIIMSALAMPIIFSDEEVENTLTEAASLRLPANAKYEWTEPQGTSYTHLGNRLTELTENIFRSFYLIAQGRSGRATPTAQSGVSKQMDMMPSKDILRAFGDLVRALMQRSIRMVSMARKDKSSWEVHGFDFSDPATLESVQATLEVLNASIPSEKFSKEMYKRIVQESLPDAAPELLRQIFEEIEAAPPKEERDMASLKKKVDLLGGSNEPKQPKEPRLAA